ncbi:MAG TPA: BON domain-containing protein [Rhizomicrobium sp.]|nr:BON domain-containing protein [Rhizomicrobium sp.]
MNDRRLQRDVSAELDFEPAVNAANIGVSVGDGVVTLSGHVDSYAEKTAAMAAVRRIKGVQAIADELAVRHPSDKNTADDQIARRALDILGWDTVVPKDAVRVVVRDGHVTLSGEVHWQFQRLAAEDDVRRLTGVVGVVNNITLKRHLQPADVKRRIEDALKRSAEVEAQSVDVRLLDDGVVELSGRVRSWQERDVVERAAWSVPGVSTVRDLIGIG